MAPMSEKKNIQDVTVKIDGDTSGLEASLDRLNGKAEKFVSLLNQAAAILSSIVKGDSRDAQT